MNSQNFYTIQGEAVHQAAKNLKPELNIGILPWTNGKRIELDIEEPIIYPLDMSVLDNDKEDFKRDGFRWL